MPVWMQRSALAIAILVALAACTAETGTRESTTSAAVAATDSTTTTEQSSSTTKNDGGATSTSTTSEVSDPSPEVDGPPAPDFTFVLADGSEFTLSEEAKPVYLVFWAEW